MRSRYESLFDVEEWRDQPITELQTGIDKQFVLKQSPVIRAVHGTSILSCTNTWPRRTNKQTNKQTCPLNTDRHQGSHVYSLKAEARLNNSSEFSTCRKENTELYQDQMINAVGGNNRYLNSDTNKTLQVKDEKLSIVKQVLRIVTKRISRAKTAGEDQSPLMWTTNPARTISLSNSGLREREIKTAWSIASIRLSNLSRIPC